MKNTYDGGEAVLEAFRNLNVEYVISSPGSEWSPVWEALARQKVEDKPGPAYLDCGHELLAVGVATGYTQVTGRMQAVLLHAGAGLLMGSMAIQGARTSEVPMVIMSGESLTYGENPDFHPGGQWYPFLGIVGGPQRLMAPITKWANQATSLETLYQTVIRSGEIAQRTPQGPVYLNVPVETMVEQWTKPDKLRTVPAVPKVQPVPSDVDAVATLLNQAKCPIIVTESAGRNAEAYATLVALADLMAIPVIQPRAAAYANFPSSHPLSLGADIKPYLDETDLVLLVASRVPWYPPSKFPPNAKVVAISDNPLKLHMVYQVLEADHYLEGNVAVSLQLLLEAMRGAGQSADRYAQRRLRWQREHQKLIDKRSAAEAKVQNAPSITGPLLCQTLREVMPDDVVYIDETVVHAALLREHLTLDRPHSFFRIPSGLGQGTGLALGTKLALRDRPVVLLVGDGSFLYNPVIPSLMFSKTNDLPIMIVIFNNNKYQAMKRAHLEYYPSGVAVTKEVFFGVTIDGPDYATLADLIDGHGERVEQPAALKQVLSDALAAVQGGKTAIVNVVLKE